MTRRASMLLAALLALCATAFAQAEDAGEPTTEVTWLALMVNDGKVGHVQMKRAVADGKVTTTTATDMALARAGVPLSITQSQTVVETLDGKPLAFESSSLLGLVKSVAKGTVGPDGQMKVTQTLSGQTMERTIQLPEGALFAEGLRLEQLRRGMKPGTEYEVLTFMPEILSVVKAKVSIGERQQLDLLGRVIEGIRVTLIMSVTVPTPDGPVKMDIPSISYVNDKGDLLRMDMDVAGLKVTALECDETFAKSKATSTTDFLDDLLVQCPRAIPADARKVVYTLKPKPGAKPSLPTTDTQQAAADPDGTITLTVARLEPQPGQVMPYAGDDKRAAAALEPTTYVQSRDERIVKAAREAVGDATDAAEAARRIAQWVHGHVKVKDLSIGYASASEVLQTPQGDCTEHSVLTAALCRAAGIPARIAAGLQYVPEYGKRKDIFGGHQWTQVYVGGKWVDLDATRPPAFRDACRITLATGSGDVRDFFVLIGSLNRFDIVDVKVVE